MNRKQTESFIHENFAGIIQDYPWEDTPEYTVFRHADNRKWFALIASVQYQTLNIDKTGIVNFINLKCDPDLIEEVITHPGILSAYHMNRRHWITILLDNSCNESELKSLINLSYHLTVKRQKNTLLPAS